LDCGIIFDTSKGLPMPTERSPTEPPRHPAARPAVASAGVALAFALAACAGADVRSPFEPPPPAFLAPAVGAELKACEALATSFRAPDLALTGAAPVAEGALKVAGAAIAAHCLVSGTLAERVGAVDGKTYAIRFEMRLPNRWNGRFLYQANGGLDGNVAPALGAHGGGPLTNALHKGFAVISSDAGHTAAQNPTFGLDPQARLDYGYQAVGKLTPLAKDLIRAAYGKGPDRSYLAGCSNGGRHAFVAAVRHADQYDGILAGAPGWRLPLAAVANIAGAQLYARVATASPVRTPDHLGTAFTAAERALLSRAVLARCDSIDGMIDGIVQATAACQARFDLATDVPTCAGARDGRCLTAAQKEVIAAIFAGPTTRDGKRIYSSFPFDTGHATPGVAFWEFGASLNLDSGSVGFVFSVPPAAPAGFDGPAFTLGADVDDLVRRIDAADPTYTESSLTFMTPPRPTDLSALRQRGGRMIVYHGVSDAIFSVDDTTAWYRGVGDTLGADPAGFVRLFHVPGMGHCSGGPSTDQFDLLAPLVDWVETGKAPERVVASVRAAGNPGGANADLPPDWPAARKRPLCPWPKVATFRGTGQAENPDDYLCR
jgi:feruloyl esterase